MTVKNRLEKLYVKDYVTLLKAVLFIASEADQVNYAMYIDFSTRSDFKKWALQFIYC